MYHFFDREIMSGISGIAMPCIVAAFATACQLPPPAVASPQDSPQLLAETSAFRQLIIKFRLGAIACDAAGIARFSSATRVPLEYIRPMSGDACVVRQSADSATGLEAGQETLRQHPDVELLEPDVRMKAL